MKRSEAKTDGALLTSAMEAENLRLQKKIAKLVAEKMSLVNRVRVLEEELKQERAEAKVRDLLNEVAKRGRPLPNLAPQLDAREPAVLRKS